MNWKATNCDEQNRIEQKAKQVLGYDDESLIKEMDEAKAAWEAEKAANPEAEAQADRDADEGYKKLMARIGAESKFGAGRVGNVVKVKEIKTGKKWWRSRKALVLAAALVVFGVGLTVVATAEPMLKLRVYPIELKQNIIYRSNSAFKKKRGNIEDAYEEIQNKLGIKVMILGYCPLNMQFDRLIIDNKRAVLEFNYGQNHFYFQEAITPHENELSSSIMSDRKVCEVVQNEWLNQKINIEKNLLSDGNVEYSANINCGNAYYYLAGIVDLEEFRKMIQEICYAND